MRSLLAVVGMLVCVGCSGAVAAPSDAGEDAGDAGAADAADSGRCYATIAECDAHCASGRCGFEALVGGAVCCSPI